MKKILYIISLVLIFTACDDLDRYPLDSVSSQIYFQTADQLKQYTNQFYSILPGAGSMYEEVSDYLALTTLANEATGKRTIPADASSSSWSWGTLRHINYFLEHVDQCTDAEAKAHYTGLTLFFRAYFYYDKVRRFGDVPWIDHTLSGTDDELYKPRDSRTVVMQHVVDDLDNAIAWMSDDKSNAYAVNRYTAMALKSRVCLFEGTFRKYHNLGDWETMLREAASAARMLMDEGGYTLYNIGEQPYRDMFMMEDLRQCSEMILARAYDASMSLKHNASSFTISPTTGRPGFTKRLVNQYLKTDGSRYTDLPEYEKKAMGEEMTDRDPRMEQTIFHPGHYIRKGKTEQEAYNATISSTGYQIIKYVTEEEHDTYNNSDNDMPLFRLAEVYLNYAEAKAELGEFTQADANISINLLRDRVGMPHLDVAVADANPCPYMESLYPNVCQTHKGLILEIRRERTIELVLEGHRYWDLMRWKEGKAFEQPYLGMSISGVSKNDEDEAGFMDLSGDGDPDICVWINDYPFTFGEITYYEANKDLKLDQLVDNTFTSGFVLADGTPDDLTAGRQWDENKDYLYPIPVRERVLSNGALSQNPGWVDGLSF